jgi:hypothetical protein
MNGLKKALRTGTMIMFCTLTSACISVEYGTPLITEGLESLELGKSTPADILLALGQPRGNGSMHVSQSPEPRDLLYYEYIKSDGKNTELEILTVLIHDQRYDGYLWFASSERIRKQGGFLKPKEVVQGYFPETGPLEDVFVRGRTSRDDILHVLVRRLKPPPSCHLRTSHWTHFFEDLCRRHELCRRSNCHGHAPANSGRDAQGRLV